MARRFASAGTLALATLIATACPLLVRAAPEQGAPPAKPAPAKSSRFSVKTGTCKEFLQLADHVRGLVVAWTAGRYHTLDRWVLDEATAEKVVHGVEQSCQEHPEASFRYQVVGEVKKLK